MAYTITFEENGGSTVTDLTGQTELPTSLPTTTKANNVFAGWYLDSSFTQKAVAGATIESNVTLYAKWYTPSSWCEDIADAIREKEGSSEPIKHVDFADRIEALPSPKEEETKTLEPDFSGGNQVITPTSGKVMTSVTLTKPSGAEAKILDGETLMGIVGTGSSGGGGAIILDNTKALAFLIYRPDAELTDNPLTSTPILTILSSTGVVKSENYFNNLEINDLKTESASLFWEHNFIFTSLKIKVTATNQYGFGTGYLKVINLTKTGTSMVVYSNSYTVGTEATITSVGKFDQLIIQVELNGTD